MEYVSQIGQDRIVDIILNQQENGFFVDLGAQEYKTWNNTYFFEKYRNWKGIGVEMHPAWTQGWSQRPKTAYYVADARLLNYKFLLKSNNVDVIDYLSLDLDPPEVTLEMLEYFTTNNLKFKVMTFEVDAYRQDKTKDISRSILNSNGYELAYELLYTDRNANLSEVHVDDVWINKEYKNQLNLISVKDNQLKFDLQEQKFTNL